MQVAKNTQYFGITCYTKLTLVLWQAIIDTVTLEIWYEEKAERSGKMANYAKYTKGASGHMLKHYERGKDEHGEYVKFGNQDIDLTRTHLNYNLAPEHNQLDFIHERLDEVYCMKRKDVNVMCTWVVTAPKDLEEGREREFFQEAYDFMADKYGRDNVVSAYVHMDEKSPHMHFCFMPIVEDQKRGLKVSAKECVTRRDLERFHGELQQYMESRGIQCSIVNEATLEGNKAIKELKRGTARQELEEIQQKQEIATAKYDEALKGAFHILNQKTTVSRELQAVTEELTDKKKELDDIPRQIAEKTQYAVDMAKIWYGDPNEIEQQANEQKAILEQTQSRVAEADEILQRTVGRHRTVSAEVEQLTEDKGNLQKDIADAQKQLKALQGQILSQEQVRAFAIKKGLFGGSKAVIEGTPEELQSLKATAERVHEADELASKAARVLKYRDNIIGKAKREAESIVITARNEVSGADRKIELAKIQANDILTKARNEASCIIEDAKKESLQECMERATREANLENKVKHFERVLEASPELQEHFKEIEGQLRMQQNRTRGRHR